MVEKQEKKEMDKTLLEAKKEDLRLALHDKMNYYESLINDLTEIQNSIEKIEDEYDLGEQFDRFKEFNENHQEEEDY